MARRKSKPRKKKILTGFVATGAAVTCLILLDRYLYKRNLVRLIEDSAKAQGKVLDVDHKTLMKQKIPMLEGFIVGTIR